MKTEIKLDTATLPKDGEWCEYDIDTDGDLVGYYDKEENAFFENGKGLPLTAFEIHFWKPLKIDWDFHKWIEQGEGTAELWGSDRFGNDYTARGQLEGLSIAEGTWMDIEEIDCVGAHSEVV